MPEMSVEERIARIQNLLADMHAHTADMREEILVATEQLLHNARLHHEESVRHQSVTKGRLKNARRR